MDVDELMKLERPLTDEEMNFMEEKLLELTRELGSEIQRITKDLDPNDPIIAKLRAGPAKVTRNVESAIECRHAEKEHIRWSDRMDRKRAKRRDADFVYTWEKLPVYEWNNEFARVIGRLLASVPKRFYIHLHNLAGLATLISNCIALGHRDCPPGESAPPEELRAYRTIGCQATITTMDILEDLSSVCKTGRNEMAHGMSLVGKIRTHFEAALNELDEAAADRPALVH